MEEAEARARLAEAELLAMLDLEAPDVAVGADGRSGSAKGKTGGKAKGKGGKRRFAVQSTAGLYRRAGRSNHLATMEELPGVVKLP